MKKILAFGASNSRNSINKKLANWAAQQIPGTIHTLIDLNDFEMPIYSIDREKENGIPNQAQQFKELIKSHDAILISFAEHNGNVSAAFKNIFDWVSRLEGKVWDGKPMMLLATSPGGRGGASVLEIVTKSFPFRGGKVMASFSLPSFKQNFSSDNGITNGELKNVFLEKINLFEKEINSEVII
ncbi:MAG: NAD(P)H-dependent oxidoreductase [Bacteroidota bacterium]